MPLNPRFQRALQRRARILAILALLLLGLPLASPWLASLNADVWAYPSWLLDLAVHWQWLAWSLLLVSSLILLLSGWRGLGWLLALPLPWLTAGSTLEPAPEVNGPVLTLASANLHLDNRHVGPLADWLATAQPDLVVLLELSPDYAQQLAGLRAYPYQQLYPEPGPFGIGLLSRQPLTQVNWHADDTGIGRIDAQINWAGQPIRLTALHPMPPLSPEYHQRRNRLLTEVAIQHQASRLPALMLGDFNASPWSSALAGPYQHGFQRATGLTPTWPSHGFGPWGIPIDQVLANSAWTLVAQQRGPDLGSDHWPVLVRLALKPNPSLAPD